MLPTCGERSGEEGAGDDDETPESPAEIDVARCGSKPYLGGVIVINIFPTDLEFVKKIYTTQFSGKRILHTENT